MTCGPYHSPWLTVCIGDGSNSHFRPGVERRSILSTFLRGDEHVINGGREEEASRFMREVHPDLVIAEGSVAAPNCSRRQRNWIERAVIDSGRAADSRQVVD